MIHFDCPDCGHSHTAPPTAAGRNATCGECGRPIVVPADQSITLPAGTEVAAESLPAIDTTGVVGRKPAARSKQTVWIAAAGAVGFVVVVLLLAFSGDPEPKPVNEPGAAEAEETGLEELALVSILNSDPNRRTAFRRAAILRDGTVVYSDLNSNVLLIMTGPPDDLSEVLVAVALDDQPAIQVEDFGLIVKRAAFAAEPGWSREVLASLDDGLGPMLENEAGVTVTRGHLVGRYRLDLTDESFSINFSITRNRAAD